jgi:hypothetical protein
MVVVKNIPVKATAVLAVAAICNLTSCKKYDEGPAFSLRTKKMRLTGEWELDKLVSSNGTVSSDINVEFEFEKDGDFTMIIQYSYYGYGSYTYSYKGDWEWEDSKEKIEIQIGNSITEYEIIRLTNKELILEDDYLNEFQFDKQ